MGAWCRRRKCCPFLFWFAAFSSSFLATGFVDCKASIFRAEGSNAGQWVQNPHLATFPIPRYNDNTPKCAKNAGYSCPSRVGGWVWQPPKQCGPLPPFDIGKLLAAIEDSCILFVGDSLMEQQYKSLICMLGASIKTLASLTHLTFDVILRRLMFVGGVYLVEASPGHGRKFFGNVPISHWEHVRLQKPMFHSAQFFKGCKTILLGVGQHFLHPGNEYWLANGAKVQSEIVAHETALASVRDELKKLNTTATIYYRTFSPDHFYGGWYYANGTCSGIHAPYQTPLAAEYSHGTYLENHTKDFRDAAVRVFVHEPNVHILDVTGMSAARGDMHRANWKTRLASEDCVHWCMGKEASLPDYWNLLFVSQLAPAKPTSTPRRRLAAAKATWPSSMPRRRRRRRNLYRAPGERRRRR